MASEDRMNFASDNTTVVAPPRQSLVRVNSDSASLALWSGWTVETIGCSAVKGRIQSGWTGKLLLNVTDCTVPYAWDNESFTLTGDLALFIPAGIDAKNDLTFVSRSATVKRTLHLIVPADGHRPLQQAMVVTATAPRSPSAKAFTALVRSKDGRSVMRKFGFLLPGDTMPSGNA